MYIWFDSCKNILYDVRKCAVDHQYIAFVEFRISFEVINLKIVTMIDQDVTCVEHSFPFGYDLQAAYCQ